MDVLDLSPMAAGLMIKGALLLIVVAAAWKMRKAVGPENNGFCFAISRFINHSHSSTANFAEQFITVSQARRSR